MSMYIISILVMTLISLRWTIRQYDLNIPLATQVLENIEVDFIITGIATTGYKMQNAPVYSCPMNALCYHIDPEMLFIHGIMNAYIRKLIFTNGTSTSIVRFITSRPTETTLIRIGEYILRNFEIDFEIQNIISYYYMLDFKIANENDLKSLEIRSNICGDETICVKRMDKSINVKGIFSPLTHIITAYKIVNNEKEIHSLQLVPTHYGIKYDVQYGYYAHKTTPFYSSITKIVSFPSIPKFESGKCLRHILGYYIDKMDLIICGRINYENVFIVVYTKSPNIPEEVIYLRSKNRVPYIYSLGEKIDINIKADFQIKSVLSDVNIVNSNNCNENKQLCYKIIEETNSLKLTGKRPISLNYIALHSNEYQKDNFIIRYFKIPEEAFIFNANEDEMINQLINVGAKIAFVSSNLEIMEADNLTCYNGKLCYKYQGSEKKIILISGILTPDLEYITIFGGKYNNSLFSMVFNAHSDLLSNRRRPDDKKDRSYNFGSNYIISIMLLLFGIGIICFFIFRYNITGDRMVLNQEIINMQEIFVINAVHYKQEIE